MFQVLIAEDDRDLRQLFSRVLEKNGYDYAQALSFDGNAFLCGNHFSAGADYENLYGGTGNYRKGYPLSGVFRGYLFSFGTLAYLYDSTS